jgi:predicted nuclease with TOPRIM domain
MNRQHPCANSKLSGCEGFVTQKGHILCESCTENRKNMAQNRREHDFDELLIKNREIEQELLKTRSIEKTLQDTISRLEREKSLLEERIEKLIDEKRRMEKDRGVHEINSSQVELDNEKLLIDNNQLKIANNSLTAQNDLLIKENAEISKNIETILAEKKTRKASVSKIPERKKG